MEHIDPDNRSREDLDRTDEGKQPAKRRARVTAFVEIDEPPAETDEQRAREERKYRLDERRYKLEIAILIALTAYALITYALYRKTVGSAKIARQQIEMSQRPWVPADFEIAGPLTFDESRNATLTLRFMPKNTGSSVATGINFRSELVPHTSAAVVDKKRSELCDQVRRWRNPGTTIFPGDTWFEMLIPASARGADVDAATIQDAESGKSYVSFTVIACIVYRPVFEGGRHHKTAYAFHLTTPEEPIHGTLGAGKVEVGAGVAASGMRLVQSPFNGVWAD